MGRILLNERVLETGRPVAGSGRCSLWAGAVERLGVVESQGCFSDLSCYVTALHRAGAVAR